MDTRISMRFVLLCALSLAVAVVFAGCGGGGGGGGDIPPPSGDSTPPTVTGTTVVPPAGGWTFLGGNATIRANVTDASGVKSVTATLTASSTTNLTLAKTTGSTYQVVTPIPANLTAAAIRYTVAVTAKDNADNVRTSTIFFDIPASDVPPPPPAP